MGICVALLLRGETETSKCNKDYNKHRQTDANVTDLDCLPFFLSGFNLSSVMSEQLGSSPELLALKHESRILGHSSNPECGFSMMKQVMLCAVWTMENWLGASKEPHTGLDDCLRVLLSCFRYKTSEFSAPLLFLFETSSACGKLLFFRAASGGVGKRRNSRCGKRRG